MSLTPQDSVQDPRIAPYLDGVLSDAERAALERDMESSESRRAEIAVHREIEGSLRRLFDDGEAAASPAALSISRRRHPLRWLAAAAVLAIAATAAFLALRPDPLLIHPEVVWNNVEKANFVPSWKCVDDAEFRAYLQSRMGESFTIAESPSLQVVGWAYGRDYAQYPLSKDTLILINRVGAKHSIVMIDRIDKERRLTVPPATGLHLFTRHVGGLVLYELTPLDTPVVLDAIRTSA